MLSTGGSETHYVAGEGETVATVLSRTNRNREFSSGVLGPRRLLRNKEE